MTMDYLFKTYDDLRFYDSKLVTPFPEMLNSSGTFRKQDTSITNTVTSKALDTSQANSGLVTVDTKMKNLNNTASKINIVMKL